MAIKVLKATDPALVPVHQGDTTGTDMPPTMQRFASDAHPLGEGEPSLIEKLNGMMGPLAHPQTSGDVAGLLLPSGGIGGSVIDRLLQLARRPIVARGALGLGGATYGAVTAPDNASLPARVGRMAEYGAGAALAPNILQRFAPEVGDAIRGMVSKASAMNNPLTVAGREGMAANREAQAVSASRAFNDLPLAEQMKQFPQTPAPELSRGAQPPIQNLGAEAPKNPLLDKSLGIQPSPPSVSRVTDNPNWKPQPRVSLASPPERPPITVSPSSPMQPPSAPMPSIEGRPLPLYPSAGTVKGVTSNNLEAASNLALAAGHWDEAERLIGQSLQSFFQGSGGPMAGVLAAAIAHKARQVVEPLRANPAFQQAPPAKQQQMIQQALRQPGARGALTGLLGS